MSVRFSASDENLTRTTNLFSLQGAFTVFGRSYVVTDTGATYQNLVSFTDGVSRYLGLYWETDGVSNTMRIEGFMGNSVSLGSNFASRPAVGNWFDWALTCNGSNVMTGYWDLTNGSSWVTTTADPTGGDFTAPTVMGISGDAFFDGRIFDVRIWTALLSSAQLTTERAATSPVVSANLDSYYPLALHTVLTDSGPNGRAAWTAAGTLSTEADPTIGGGSTTYKMLPRTMRPRPFAPGIAR